MQSIYPHAPVLGIVISTRSLDFLDVSLSLSLSLSLYIRKFLDVSLCLSLSLSLSLIRKYFFDVRGYIGVCGGEWK